ncbi:unnamed protein product, partial [marine sediment metagenome]
MIWALIFAFLAATLGGSPLLLPNIDKLAKEHIEDKDRKDNMLILIKEAQTQRKAFAKKDKKISKQLNKVFALRESSRQDFTILIDKWNESREELQAVNQKLIYDSQNIVTEQEWENMKPDFKEGIEKLDKQTTKKRKQLDKAFIKMESKFKKTIEDDEKSQKAILMLNAFKVSIHNTMNGYSEQMLDENSIVYEYTIEKQQIIDIQDKHAKILNEALSSYIDLHFT